MASENSPPVVKVDMHVPPLEEAAKVLQVGLEKNFKDVSVRVVECPDLTQKPFNLSCKGLCGSPRIADIGGPPYLLPLPQKDKVFSLQQISKLVDLPGAFMIGAGAGPCHVLGTNSEMVCNVRLASQNNDDIINTRIIKATKEDGFQQEKISSTEFCLMANLFCSEGMSGKVLEVEASRRKGADNFMSCMRTTLGKHYGNKPVALGGTFLVERGKAKIHVMRDFSSTPLTCDEDVDKWLLFFEMDAPLVCVGELVSFDPGYDLRVEHFHCFSEHGQGGHYHYDTTPMEVKYRGYFSLAESVYRIDQPVDSHLYGRD